MRKFVLIFTVIILTFFFQDQLFAQRRNQVKTVVIDAGHGGHDTGARGRNTREKDIALSIALKTGALIQRNCPGVEVIYTRETDVFVELFRRAQIANENKADLFISIHCNANPSPFAYGTETYVMGLHKSDANLAVARAENASILLEDNYSKRYDGFDPNSSEAYIIFNLFQNAYLDKSLDFASRVENNFTANTKLPDRGVKQAGFLVLYKTTMPGVLVETGFLSNSNEEAFLNSLVGQDRIAFSIYRAFDEFKRTTEGKFPEANTSEDSLFKKQPATNLSEQDKIEQALRADTFGYRNNRNNEPETNTKKITQIGSSKVRSLNQNNTVMPKEKPLMGNDVLNNETGNRIFSSSNPNSISSNPNLKTTNSNLRSTNSNSRSTNPNSRVNIPESVTGGLKFRVQFMISTKEISLDGPEFKDIPNLKEYVHGGEFKYTAGDELAPKDADKIRRLLAEKGYRDAFVLPFLNENRINMKDALQMIKNKK